MGVKNLKLCSAKLSRYTVHTVLHICTRVYSCVSVCMRACVCHYLNIISSETHTHIRTYFGCINSNNPHGEERDVLFSSHLQFVNVCLFRFVSRNFSPSPGSLTYLHPPLTSDTVRVDTGVVQGGPTVHSCPHLKHTPHSTVPLQR